MITIYGKDNCTFCDQAIMLCESTGVPYQYKKLGVDFDKEWLVAHIGIYGVVPRSMPQIEHDGRYIGGFKELKENLA